MCTWAKHMATQLEIVFRGLGILVTFSQSEAGLALNRGFFEGFDPHYEDISYALGRAVALNATAEEL